MTDEYEYLVEVALDLHPHPLTPGQWAMLRARAAKVQRKAEVAARLTDRRLTWKRPGVWQKACRVMGIKGY